MFELVESSDDAIAAMDLHGTVLSWNASAERISGYSADEFIGRNISLLAPTDRADELPDILDKIMRGAHDTRFAGYVTSKP